jgi:hypothetical protein
MSTLVFPAWVRDQVLQQHDELRALLQILADTFTDPLGPDERSPERLTTAGRDLCARFRAHLAFEDEALKPVLAVLDSWGPERVRGLEEDHKRQRRRIDSVVATLESSCDLGEVSLALCDLVEDLRRDMEDEEQGCLRAAGMSDALLTVERR